MPTTKRPQFPAHPVMLLNWEEGHWFESIDCEPVPRVVPRAEADAVKVLKPTLHGGEISSALLKSQGQWIT